MVACTYIQNKNYGISYKSLSSTTQDNESYLALGFLHAFAIAIFSVQQSNLHEVDYYEIIEIEWLKDCCSSTFKVQCTSILDNYNYMN